MNLVVASFERPTQDFAPMLLLMTPAGELIEALDPKFLGSHQSRLMLTEHVVPGLIIKHEANAAALVMPMWQVRPDQVGKPLELVERDHGRDGVVVQVATTDTVTWQAAYLNRFKDKPPTLDEWMHPDPASPANSAGEAMQEALRLVAHGRS